jgi:hypothetical protein
MRCTLYQDTEPEYDYKQVMRKPLAFLHGKSPIVLVAKLAIRCGCRGLTQMGVIGNAPKGRSCNTSTGGGILVALMALRQKFLRTDPQCTRSGML